MKVDLDGRAALVVGRDSAVIEAVVAALITNGAGVSRRAPADTVNTLVAPDLLVVAHDLVAEGDAADVEALVAAADRIGEAMQERGGRVIVLTASFGLLPARRHAVQSVATARTVAAMRALAMRLGPNVQVNAVGAGAIEDGEGGFLAGGAALLSHVPFGEAGTIEDIVHAVLFLADPMNSYMTGQVLTVDGGWGAGYGRNF
ncbi:SDR family oxidoreductase [Kaistia dalseonensis]|uniref:NAD(P)-dependent dehydrogenase (Short-subunit alcohol dehydrogenase family) n=1 Tax=Kaistia dalseonensis TaxID=410840 RepID=A0ABU0H436_9HYPH|nr:SDR family oxidoreductase [Kaistia dalseonensis]MCX5494070.1 SDR family oxidoreductase [Kaistia dalseonensis]MDQ0436648.1 NAD(P)-dependent dehydrogenase (short-subunit alcohol dehydrogenase family) [Kaistia dalseonensis]